MSQEPRKTVFFIDRCLGKHPILEMLQDAGASVEIHDDHFSQNALDTQWIPEIGERGWVILTKDARIARNSAERKAVAYARIRMFTLVSKNLTGEQTALAFQNALASMLRFVNTQSAPLLLKSIKIAGY